MRYHSSDERSRRLAFARRTDDGREASGEPSFPLDDFRSDELLKCLEGAL